MILGLVYIRKKVDDAHKRVNDSNAIAESFLPAWFGEVAIENVDPQLQLTSLLIKMAGLAIPNQTWKQATKEAIKKKR